MLRTTCAVLIGASVPVCAYYAFRDKQPHYNLKRTERGPVLFVGSKSLIKVNAVHQALRNTIGWCPVLTYECDSGVSEQPSSLEEAVRGAKNRAAQIEESYRGQLYHWNRWYDHCQVFVGIENGAWKNANGELVDVGVVHVRVRETGNEMRSATFCTDELKIPSSDEELQKLGIERAENGCWSNLKDPHLVITQGERSRADFIAEAMQKWIRGEQVAIRTAEESSHDE